MKVKTAKLFKNGRSQAVRIPKEFQMEGSEVYIKQVGNSVILLPKDAPWTLFHQGLSEFSDDFMNERKQPMIPGKLKKK